MKPTPLTDDYIAKLNTQEFGVVWYWEDKVNFARAIESARDAQWEKMLGEQEPVAIADNLADNRIRALKPLPLNTKLYTHPAPDHTALLRQALDALESIEDRFGQSRSEFIFSQRCAIDKARAAITAINEALK